MTTTSPARLAEPGPALPTVGQLLAGAGAALRDSGVADPTREARLLLGHALGRAPAALLDRSALVYPGNFASLVARRRLREPLALITGSAGFWSLELEVSAATLIPRPDSETLIEAALACCDRPRISRVLDLGTGTGCLLLAALAEFPAAWGVGVDVDPDAVALAARNARRCGFADRAAFVRAEWSAPLSGSRFDLVLANPPYIPAADIAGLMPEVSRHEPRLALDGGADGLDAYRTLLAGLPGRLAPGGLAILELGVGQAKAVTGLAERIGLEAHDLRSDLGGVPRALVLRAAEKTIGSVGRDL